MGGEVILHTFWRSSCSWRVRTALEMKKLQYRCVPVDIVKQREHTGESYARVNPMQKVPSLRIDGRQISESYNIIMYLEETRPAIPLLPKEAINRAMVREVCEIIQSGIQPLQNVGLLHALPVPRVEKEEWARHWIQRGFRAIETKLSACAGTYCFGDSVTMADLFLAPQVFNARGYKVDVESFPTISRVYSALLSLEPFVKSHPYRQEDTPLDMKDLPV